MDKDTLFKEINDGILKDRYLAFRSNLAKNMKFIKLFGGLTRVIPRFNSKCVIVVGAGPSLDGEIDTLKKCQYRREIVIISTDMALAPLVRNDICPEYVISCETTPLGFFHSFSTEKMHLLAFSCLSNTNLRSWKGDISFYNWMMHDPVYSELWKLAGVELGYVATGGIVTTQAVSFALGCGIQALMLVGNDLGFKREFYSRGTEVYNCNQNRSNRLAPVETIELDAILKRRDYIIKRSDNIYFTNNQFLTAKMWLEGLFDKVNIPLYDSSEPGCSGGSIQKTELKKFLNMMTRRPKKKR